MSNRLIEINERLRQVYALIAELDTEYQGKIKGEVYAKRVQQLREKRESLMHKAYSLGTGHSICLVKGKRRRPNRKNPALTTVVNFQVAFVGITEEELPHLLKFRIKGNIISYDVHFIKSGDLIEI